MTRQISTQPSSPNADLSCVSSQEDHASPRHAGHGDSLAITVEIAAAFTELWRERGFHAAGIKYWSDDIVSFEPGVDGCCGLAAVQRKSLDWLETHGVEDLALDGPFVTGDRFAVFADMVIAHAGKRTTYSQIAVFTVTDSKISQERFFHA